MLHKNNTGDVYDIKHMEIVIVVHGTASNCAFFFVYLIHKMKRDLGKNYRHF